MNSKQPENLLSVNSDGRTMSPGNGAHGKSHHEATVGISPLIALVPWKVPILGCLASEDTAALEWHI
jgi:hypothetical protein